MRDLEQTDVLVARVRVPLCRLDQSVPEVGAQDRLLGRQRLGQPHADPVLRRPARGSRCTPRTSRRRRERPRRRDEDAARGVSRPNIAVRSGSVVGHLVQPEATDLLDEIDVARHVPRTPARHRHRQAVGNLEAEPLERLLLLLDGGREPEQRVDALRPKADDRPVRQLALHVGRAGPARAGQLDEELRRVDGRLLGELWIDTLLPPSRGLRAEPQPSRAAQDRQRVEIRGLEQDVGRRRR